MRHGLLIGLALACLALPARAPAGDGFASGAGPPRLRGWFVGLQMAAGGRDTYDVFGRPDLPPAPVEDAGRGGGLHVGHRFGSRFLLGLQLSFLVHDMEGVTERFVDTEFLVTGTVLFRERETLQPFLRGGFGGTGSVLERPEDGSTLAIGTAAIAGAGLQVRLGSRLSLEFEAAATFSNLLEVRDDADGDGDLEEEWSIRRSQVGWRSGVGIMVWF